MLVRLTTPNPVFISEHFPDKLVVHTLAVPRRLSRCNTCDPVQDEEEVAELLVPDGKAYPGHYIITPGTWYVSPKDRGPSWEIQLMGPSPKAKKPKPWMVTIKPITRMTATIPGFKTPSPTLRVVK